MRAALLALLAAGCARPAEDPGVFVADDTGPADDTASEGGADWLAPALSSPAEAEDLDPDPDVLHVRLVAAPHEFTLNSPEGAGEDEDLTVQGYAYNGQVPGPTLRAKRGDTVIVEVENELDVPTTVHWHGLEVPNDMDGVPWMRDPIAPGESFTYTFTVEQAGTFWYHPHFDSERQVDLGLYGAFVLEDPADPRPEDDLVLVFDDWVLPGYGAPNDDREDDPHGATGAEGLWTVNGLVQPALSLRGGERARLRLINASNAGYLDLSWPELRVIGGDQGLLAEAESPDSLVLSPGDRADVELLPAEADFVVEDLGYSHHGGASWEPSASLFTATVEDPSPAGEPLDWPFPGGTVSEDPGRTDLFYTFSGDPNTGVWMINGEVFPDVTVAELALGADAVLEVRNLSPTEHPFHLHGLVFELLSLDGVAPAAPRWEDTLNLPIHGAARLRLSADNPGDWMLHCHILPHADDGMMTVLRVLSE